jgi:hypothetical protein
MGGVKSLRLWLACAIVASALGPAQADVVIGHQAAGCLVAGRFPLLEARLDPAAAVARARVLFRAAGTEHWYAVDMTAHDAVWQATLPKPRASLGRVEYYIEATDRTYATVRTGQHAPEVARNAGGCRKDAPIAAASGAERVAVTVPAGAPAVPPGFMSSGLAGVGGFSGGAVAGVVGGGAAIAGAVVVAGGGDGDGPESTTPTTTLPPSIAGAWVGTLPDGVSREMNDTGSTVVRCHRDDDLFLDLAQNGTDVTGSARYVSRAGTNCNMEPLGTVREFAVTGTFDGRAAVSLRLFVMLPDGPSIHVLTGSVTGSRMTGAVTSTFPAGGGQGTWSARRP